MCEHDLPAGDSEVWFQFLYNMHGADKTTGAGLWVYLMDPTVDGWDTEFDGSGTAGFVGKTGAVLGVALDNSGDLTLEEGQGPNHLMIRGAEKGSEIFETAHVEGGFMTEEEEWKKVRVRLDVASMVCDVMLNGSKIADKVSLGERIEVPRRLCLAVCGAATSQGFMISVNDVKFATLAELEAEEDEEEGVGVPKGCTDYEVGAGGQLQKSSQEQIWRCAGATVVRDGMFELTQGAEDQEGHVLCRQPFVSHGVEVHASVEYSMSTKACNQHGGHGICIYLLDPTIPGWDRSFNGAGPLGFVGKAGAILGVGLESSLGDSTGEFFGEHPGAVAVRRASDSKLLCEAVALEKHGEEGVESVSTDGGEWRMIKAKFDIADMTVTVKIGGYKYLDNVSIDLGQDEAGNPIKIPSQVCVAVCAGVAGHWRVDRICVNNLKVDTEEETDR
eukprot:TRINITY_DN6733_c0_g1_i6.p1 TRINITY_DN6733_c0_g1~~TRINITY_DN6733_c0_g1_i6.p1  ORF type:complete len:445 (-),score=101.82 TRINITY_DN6733_c0_g1_i6:109-1443(-)